MNTADTAKVFTLADLAAWNQPGTHLAVLGHPVAHSLSPVIHNAALAAMSARDPRYRDWRYHRFDIAPEYLPRALKLFHEKKFRGLNLTAPHKVIAFGILAPGDIDPAARPIGAINTLAWTPQGWRGSNTDGHGLAAAIRETLGLDLAGARILLLGAGGAARSAAVECLQRRCATLGIANRTPAHLDALLAAMRPLADANGVRIHAVAQNSDGVYGTSGTSETSATHGTDAVHETRETRATPDPRNPQSATGVQQPATRDPRPSNTIIINATSSGLRPGDAAPLDLKKLPAPPSGVFDMIYNPPQTPLLAQAAALNIPRANGLAMLVHQGARSLEIWTGEKIPVAAMFAALR